MARVRVSFRVRFMINAMAKVSFRAWFRVRLRLGLGLGLRLTLGLMLVLGFG